tara:strand:- start:12 stop:1001 length:990 start_codon:yes stop_codon:yes gene_type:complete
MRKVLLVILLGALSGCGEKKEAVGGANEVPVSPEVTPVTPQVIVEEKTLAEFIKNKRVYIGVGAETGFGQFYGNGTWQSGSVVNGVATTSGGSDEKGRYEVDELTITLISEDGGEDLLDFSSPEPVVDDKLTITKETGDQDIVTIIKIEEAGIVQVVSSDSKDEKDADLEQPGANAADVAIGFIVGGDAASLRAYLEKGGDVNGEDKDGNTLLQVTATFGRSEIAEILIAAEADLDCKNKDGSTPLMTAAFLGEVEVVKLLVEAGADASLRSNDNTTALEAAELSWVEAKGIMDFLNALIFVPTGQPLDMEKVKAGRIAAADILKGVGD